MLTYHAAKADSAQLNPAGSKLHKPDCSNCSRHLNCLVQQLSDSGCDAAPFAETLSRPLVRERGQHLFHIGDEFRCLYLVRSGSVKVYTIDNDGGEHILGFYLPGDIIGLEAIAGGVHDCAAVSMEAGHFCALAFDQLQQLSHTLSGLQQSLQHLYVSQIAREHAVVRLLSKRSAEQRLAGFLLDLSRRLNERGYCAQEFSLSMSRHEIGNHLGLALETVSRLLTRLSQDGVVQIKRRCVLVRNPALLAELAGETVPVTANPDPQTRKISSSSGHFH